MRDDVLLGEPFLAERAPERRAAVAKRIGEAQAAEAERRAVLSVLDQLWSDYLAELAAVREGIVLRVVGRQDPLFEFQKTAVERFDVLLRALEQDALEALESATLEGSELRLDGCPPAPGATWTYLTSEDDFRSPGGGFMLGLARLFWSRAKGGSAG
jgi:preprotein translocase subunit SecA